MRTAALLALVVAAVACGGGGSENGTSATAGAGGAPASGGKTSTSGGTAGKAGGGGGAAGGGVKGGGGGSVAGAPGGGGATVPTSSGPPPAECKDGKWDGSETDIDCGGDDCPTRCAAGKRCVLDSDCEQASPPLACPDATYRCTDPCVDYKMDGDETGVDCGGSCPLKCVGEPCTAKMDCQSQNCDTTAGKCLDPAHPLILIKQQCWDGITGFNAGDKAIAKKEIVPCMITNDCCAQMVSTCTDECFKNVDAVCGLNKFSGGASPHAFIIAYYKNCVP
jgi:hypothetical protein